MHLNPVLTLFLRSHFDNSARLLRWLAILAGVISIYSSRFSGNTNSQAQVQSGVPVVTAALVLFKMSLTSKYALIATWNTEVVHGLLPSVSVFVEFHVIIYRQRQAWLDERCLHYAFASLWPGMSSVCPLGLEAGRGHLRKI